MVPGKIVLSHNLCAARGNLVLGILCADAREKILLVS